jgi:hypothetical protein
MRECWVNVYGTARAVHCGARCFSREETDRLADLALKDTGIRPVYRLHVRLKPEPATHEVPTREQWERFMARL